MSRSNVSHASNSKAASIAFRQNELYNADIYFRPYSHPIPQEVQALREHLLSMPVTLRHAENASEVTTAISQLDAEERVTYDGALQQCMLVHEAVIESCSLQHERVWMREVNEPILTCFFNARRARLVSSNEDYLWTCGRELTSGHSSESLNDPKPDVAIGLHAIDSSTLVIPDRHAWNPLSTKALETLRAYPPFFLTYSPSERRDLIYPAIIYEAKSDSNPILWAENQAAVGVARALGLLSELARMAESTSIPPVFAITSAGSTWQLHIAFVALNGSIVSRRTLMVSSRRTVLDSSS